uniref:Uncharacterized protein n=1 Tax=Alexandrium catenella TaxID=2925 RepID=A0A7S1RR88_ALECA|mmetsp:Transcript_69859/g.185695  ORF Transcript_69859/g.185695 Transcript_69859/m.185695 type:complete len:244 (+) Transcript_69859:103-834(+)
MSSQHLLVILLAAAQATGVVEGGTTCPNTIKGDYKSVSLVQASAPSSRRLVSDVPLRANKQLAEDASNETWRSVLQARVSSARHFVDTWCSVLQSQVSSARHRMARAVERALGAHDAALATKGGFEATLIVVLVVGVVGGTVCCLWHNNWSVLGAAHHTREVAGKAVEAANKGTHAGAVRIENMTREKQAAAGPGASRSGAGSPLGGRAPMDAMASDRRAAGPGQEEGQASPGRPVAEPTECC